MRERISHQGWESRKEPELIRRLALCHERRDIGNSCRCRLPASQCRVTFRTNHRHQRIAQRKIRVGVALSAGDYVFSRQFNQLFLESHINDGQAAKKVYACI